MKLTVDRAELSSDVIDELADLWAEIFRKELRERMATTTPAADGSGSGRSRDEAETPMVMEATTR